MRQRVALLVTAACTVFAVACAQTDIGITTAVKTKLAQDDLVKAYRIDVDTSNKVVTLKGTVATAAEEERAIALARQTDGVQDVVDRLDVNPQTADIHDSRTDDLSEKAKQTAEAIGEKTREVAGRAGAAIQDEARVAAAKTGEAARRATNDVADGAQAFVSDAATTSAVKAKLLADPAVHALKIDVDTTGGIVTLNGTVDTRSEADRAVALARETNGVAKVVDNLKVGRPRG